MPFLYIYSPTDFIGGLPNEQSAAAQGTPPFNLTLAPGATPTVVEITDNDGVFNEIDASQDLTSTVTIDGTTYNAGTGIFGSYDLINTTTGHQVTGVHIGGNGFQQGAVQGLASSIELVPGTTYTFNFERTSYQQGNQYDDYVACFCDGTLIETDMGEVPVEHLAIGDRVRTLDSEFLPIRWIGHRTVEAEELEAAQNLYPVRIATGALGNGLPERPLKVSPQHRVLVTSKIAKSIFDQAEILVPAIKLVSLPGINIARSTGQAEYYHLLFDQHEVIFSNGAPTESLYLGPQAIKTIPSECVGEIQALFPELLAENFTYAPARCFAEPGRLAKELVRRHKKNNRPLLAEQVSLTPTQHHLGNIG